MKTVEIIGFKRANLGKSVAKELRLDANVPCVLYGGKEQVHFTAPMILFRDLVYSPDAYFVDLNVEGQTYKAILQDIQFHPVSETILHADFLELKEDRLIKMEVPVRTEGVAPGVLKGGKLVVKQRKLKVKALPNNVPDEIVVSINNLDLGKTIKVGELTTENFTILNAPNIPVVAVDIPRALRGKKAQDEK
jgi:large subunit ribosomal protein L25